MWVGTNKRWQHSYILAIAGAIIAPRLHRRKEGTVLLKIGESYIYQEKTLGQNCDFRKIKKQLLAKLWPCKEIQGDNYPNLSLLVSSHLLPCLPLAKSNWKQEGRGDWMIQFSEASLFKQGREEKDLESCDIQRTTRKRYVNLISPK